MRHKPSLCSATALSRMTLMCTSTSLQVTVGRTSPIIFEHSLFQDCLPPRFNFTCGGQPHTPINLLQATRKKRVLAPIYQSLAAKRVGDARPRRRSKPRWVRIASRAVLSKINTAYPTSSMLSLSASFKALPRATTSLLFIAA